MDSNQSAIESLQIDPMEEEQVYLEHVLGNINRVVSRLENMPRYFQDDNSEPQTADEVAQQAVEVMREAQIEGLKAARGEPYFGRLDFQEEGEPLPVPLYIGKRGLEDEQTGDRMVIDWRAPIASMFYSFTGKGEIASYESPDGTIEGNVALKRNIVIRNQLLQRVVDSFVKGQENMNVTDEFLLYRLGENKDSRLRDIVSTIQAEQDKIIRAERDKAIVIQGVAGSGKTTVALHRLAFLLYQHKENIRAERMVIFAPNAMFVDYISEVLPELGVGGIQQTTFATWALKELEQGVRLRDPARRLERWFGLKQDEVLAREVARTQYKGSMEFKERIDSYLQTVNETMIPSSDFSPWEGAVLSVEIILEWFNVEYRHYPLVQRKQRVLARVKRWYETELHRMRGADPKGVRKKLASQRFRAYEKKWADLTAWNVYEKVLPAPDFVAEDLSSVKKGKNGRRLPEVEVEDLPALLYIHVQLVGVASQSRFDHVVIDEAQDFSPFHIELLKWYCPSHSFTILGDLSQSIHTYQGITDWDAFLHLFSEDKRLFFELDVSYRSTMEIIEFANDIIRPFETFTMAKPVFRSGEPVRVEKVEEADKVKRVIETVRSLQTDANTIAVVTRSDEAGGALHQALLDAGIQASLIDATQQRYAGGVSVLPVFLTKGLEFDAVLLVDVDANHYKMDPLGAKLLYVGCTRALHRLVVHYVGTPSPLLPGDDSVSTSTIAS